MSWTGEGVADGRFASVAPSPLMCYALRLGPGEEIMSTLLDFVKSKGLSSAFVMSCVGSVLSAQLRLAQTSEGNKVVDLTEHFEIVSLVGTLSGESGHLHTSLSDKDGRVMGGHVMGNMVVFTTAEIMIGACPDLTFDRVMDIRTGFPELVIERRQDV